MPDPTPRAEAMVVWRCPEHGAISDQPGGQCRRDCIRVHDRIEVVPAAELAREREARERAERDAEHLRSAERLANKLWQEALARAEKAEARIRELEAKP